MGKLGIPVSKYALRAAVSHRARLLCLYTWGVRELHHSPVVQCLACRVGVRLDPSAAKARIHERGGEQFSPARLASLVTRLEKTVVVLPVCMRKVSANF